MHLIVYSHYMAMLGKQEVIDALTRLGKLAAEQGSNVDLLLVGGGVMVLVFGTRQATRDLDVVILPLWMSRWCGSCRLLWRLSAAGPSLG